LYQEASTLYNSNSEEKWKKAVFWVFDAPDIAEKPFEVNITFLLLLKISGANHVFATITTPQLCKNRGNNRMQKYLKKLVFLIF
jgi:hypothetical protein